jgi:hypothetical protein
MAGINALNNASLAPINIPQQVSNAKGTQALPSSGQGGQEDSLSISSEAFQLLDEASGTTVDPHRHHRHAEVELLTYSNFQIVGARSAGAQAQLAGASLPAGSAATAQVPGVASSGSAGAAKA